ncbi:hypothetical protein ACROYT_G037066 [Oculina patagonica]
MKQTETANMSEFKCKLYFRVAFLALLLSLISGVACFARLVIYRPPPAVSGTASAPLPLWVPSQCLLGDIAVCFPEGVPNPTPLSPSYLDFDPFLLSCCPKLFICYDLWPVDAHDGSQAFVDKGLQFGGVRFCYSPRFRAVKED